MYSGAVLSYLRFLTTPVETKQSKSNLNITDLTTMTTNILSTFKFEEFPVHVFTIEGEPWFVVKELAAILDYADPSMLLKHVDDDDKQVINPQKLDPVVSTESFGSNTFKLSVVNESGLYAAAFGSHKPEAKKFKKWVTSEVLPSIRKTGSYSVNQQPLTAAELLLQNVQLLVEHERKLSEQEQQLSEQGQQLVAQDNRLAVIEERFTKVDESLKALPASTEEVPTKSIRSSLNELIRSYAYRTGEEYRYLWNNLYKEYRYRHHVDLVARAKNAKLSVCEYAEQVNVIDKLYALALLLYNTEE